MGTCRKIPQTKLFWVLKCFGPPWAPKSTLVSCPAFWLPTATPPAMMQINPAPMATMAIPMGPMGTMGTMGPVQGAMPVGIHGIQCQVLVPVAMVSFPVSPAPSTVASTSVGSETGSEGLLDTAWVAENGMYPTNGGFNATFRDHRFFE